MPSRKRAKGKERKLKQQARQIVSSSSPPPAVGGDIQPEQNIPRVVEQATNLSKCLHGGFKPPRGHPVGDFIHTFKEGCASEDDFLNIVDAMDKTFENHEDVWKDSMLRKVAINIMLSVGTNLLLDGFSIGVARLHCKAIMFLENYDGEETFHSVLSKATEDLTYIMNAEEREIVRFYKKRIPCSCLNKLYSEIKKSQDRGSQCSHCNQIIKSKDLKTCSRCKFAQYCSKECQVLDWPSHKETCMEIAHVHKELEKMETTRRNEE